MKPRKPSSGGVRQNHPRKPEGEPWQRSGSPKSSLSLYPPPGCLTSTGGGDSQNAGPNQNALAQQLLMLLPGANGGNINRGEFFPGSAPGSATVNGGADMKQRQPTVEQEESLRHPSAQIPPMMPQLGLPPGAAAELGALLFADVVRKQLIDQVSKVGGSNTSNNAQTAPPVGEVNPPMVSIPTQPLDLYRHQLMAKNQQQHSPMILSTSDIANKEPASGDSPNLMAMQYDAFPDQRFINQTGFTGRNFGQFSERPAASPGEQARSGVVEVDARALLAAFLHCLTTEMKSSSSNNGSTPPRSLGESDEDLPPKVAGAGVGGKMPAGKSGSTGRINQRRSSSVFSASETCISLYGPLGVGLSGDNGSPNGSSATHNSSNSSTSSTSSKRSLKATSSGTDTIVGVMHTSTTTASSVASSPPGNNGTPRTGSGDNETLIQELVEEATTLKQQQQEAASKLSLNESEPFYWVQSFHCFERRNLIRTCLMQPPSQMTFDPRRQCFRRMPAVTLYRCNVCGDYTSKHRDKISRHLTLQHSIKPTSPSPNSPPASSTGQLPSSSSSGHLEKQTVGSDGSDGGHYGGTEIDTVPARETTPMSSANSSPTWPATNGNGPAGQQAQQPRQSVFQWPPQNRLPLAIATDPRSLSLNSNSSSNQSTAMDLTSSSGVAMEQPQQQHHIQQRSLLTVGGIIETAFYQANAASSSSPSPPLSPINEGSNSSSPAKKLKSQQTPPSAPSAAELSSSDLVAVNLSGISNGDGAFQRVGTTPDRQREFPCHYCPATFRLYVALRTHYAQCHPTSKPYTCAVNMCSFSTSQLRKLNQHQLQHQHQSQQQQRPIEAGAQKI